MTDFIWPSDTARAENDELNQVCEYLEEVLDERDEYKKAAEHYVPMAQALAAHLERLFEVWDTLTSEDRTDVPTLIQHMDDVFTDGPTTSLARRDAEKQAEALESFGKRNTLNVDALDDLMRTLKELRRQAEGETE